MPLYEYHCTTCNGVFELLRPASQAAKPQPCPECSEDSRRIVSQFEAFTQRGGYPRRIPDDGTAWHLGKKVRGPVAAPTIPNTHPELERKRVAPPAPPTAEELERYGEAERTAAEVRADAGPAGATLVTPTPDDAAISTFKKRVRQTAKQAKLAKRVAPNNQRTPRTRSGDHRRS